MRSPRLGLAVVLTTLACSSVNTNALDDGGVADTGTAPVDVGTPTDTGNPRVDTGTPTDRGNVLVDVGTPPVDVGTPPVDAGTPPMDVGTPPVDVGTPPVDVGTPPMDVGTPPMDVGTPPVDVGTPPVDVGTPPVDAGTPPTGVAVTTFQFDRARSGANRSETRLTPAAVRAGFGRVTAFAPTLDADVYAQPLYLPGLTVGGARHDVLYVATQNNTVYALDAATGATLWSVSLGARTARSMQSCGNIDPIGVVSTGVIDLATRTLYVVALTTSGSSADFKLSALDVLTGTQRTGYPVTLRPPTTGGSSFDIRATGQRGALQFDGGRLYIPFGGLYGDCGTYHGWVVGLDPSTAGFQTAFATPGRGAGIWAPGGSSIDDAGRIFVATGNGTGGTAAHGERVIRLGGGVTGPVESTDTAAWFEASDARSLDSSDLDIGSNAPVLLPPIGAAHLLWQGGKAGVSYLLNRDNLGGAGAEVFQARLFSGGNYGAGATWSNGTDTYVFAPGRGTRAGCSGTGGVMALRATATALTTAWCSATNGNPSPPAVSSNGNSNAVLWVAGASPASLRAIEVSTGMEIFSDAPPSVRQWTPVVVADGRVYVTGTRTVSLYTTR